MLSPNLTTRHRQQKAAALFVVSGVLTAVGISQALERPELVTGTQVQSAQWAATLTGRSVILVRNSRTGIGQSLIFPLAPRWADMEQITGLEVSGDQVIVKVRKVAGGSVRYGYNLLDKTRVYNARTGIQIQQR